MRTKVPGVTRWHMKQPLAGMPWSRLRKIVESFFADSVKKRAALHIAQSRTCCPHRCGRGWMTLDGVEVLSASSHHAEEAFYAEHDRQFGALPAAKEDEASKEERRVIYYAENVMVRPDYPADSFRSARADALARDELVRRGIFGEGDFCDALRWYAQTSIDDILASTNPIVRAVAMLDRRVGKRRLKAIDPEKEHMLVRRLLAFRLEAEGVAAPEK